jgi:hypothetical protein
VAKAWRQPGAGGAVAIRDGDLVGYTLVEAEHAAPDVRWAARRLQDDLQTDIEREIASPEIGSLVAERDGRIVGGVIVAPHLQGRRKGLTQRLALRCRQSSLRHSSGLTLRRGKSSLPTPQRSDSAPVATVSPRSGVRIRVA